MHRGLGQRIIATITDDTPLMEVRTISLTGSAEETAERRVDHGAEFQLPRRSACSRRCSNRADRRRTGQERWSLARL